MAKKKNEPNKSKGASTNAANGAKKTAAEATGPELEAKADSPEAKADSPEAKADSLEESESDEAAENDESSDEVASPSDAKAAAREADTEGSSARKKSSDERPSASPREGHPKLHGAAWALPLVKIERAWTWFEARMLVVVLLSLIFFMVTWISLKGLSLPLQSGSRAGTAYRMLFGIAVGGGLAQLATRKLPEARRTQITFAVILVGIGGAPLWRARGVEYCEHILNWLQEGSSLTMLGGLRGVSTRLTILLALTGASLAAASGKHINIDVVLRFFSPRIRKLVFVLSTVATLAVCVAASWGFFDYISIESFSAKKEATAGEKIEQVGHEASQDLFLFRKQIGLDFSAMFHVLGGGKWDDEGRMNGRSWNDIVDYGGYREHFTKEEVEPVLAPKDALDESRVALVVVPGGSPRGLLLHAMDLLWCWGLLNIGLRFFMRMLLVVSGHASADPEPEEFDGVIPPPDVVEAEAEAAAGVADDKEVA